MANGALASAEGWRSPWPRKDWSTWEKAREGRLGSLSTQILALPCRLSQETPDLTGSHLH